MDNLYYVYIPYNGSSWYLLDIVETDNDIAYDYNTGIHVWSHDSRTMEEDIRYLLTENPLETKQP